MPSKTATKSTAPATPATAAVSLLTNRPIAIVWAVQS